MTTPSLIDWLRTALDEDERLAREATPGPWVREWAFSTHFVCPAGDAPVASSNVSRLKPNQRADAEHIANWDPARVLAEVQSKRAILDVHPIETDLSEYERGLGTGQSFGCRRCADDDGVIKGEGYCRTLQALAEPYRSRPGFREEWKWMT